MADNTNKVTIDAAWFIELWKSKYDPSEECDNCVREMCGECNVVKERDKYKKGYEEQIAFKERAFKDYDEIAKECYELKAKLSTARNYEAVIAAKDREIEAVKDERNRLNAKVNELIKGRDERQAERDKEREKVKGLKEKLATAERCIEEIRSTLEPHGNINLEVVDGIIRAYREEKEAAR